MPKGAVFFAARRNSTGPAGLETTRQQRFPEGPMHDKRLAIVIAFVLGVGVGGLAFGQRDALPGQDGADPAGAATAVTADDAVTPAAVARVTPPAGAPQPDPPPDAGPASAGDALATAQAKDDVTVLEAAPMTRDEQLAMMLAGWRGMQDRIEQLTLRVAELEWRLPDALPASGAADATAAADADRPPPLPVDTPEDRREALVVAGVDWALAEDIVWRESEAAMARLELQDRALREGWHGTEAYFAEMRALGSQAVDLRVELGDDAYDRFLYETGQPNRVQVDSVFAGSQGEQAGILPGDIIERYAGERVFAFDDLRNATTAGMRDELVPVSVLRDNRRFEVWIARGPIGVRLESGSTAPDR
jgi:membrane-associated protease RseP (regulator of RpoE activity)